MSSLHIAEISDPQRTLKDHWESRFIKLCGRTIKGVRYMQPDELAAIGWHESTLVLILDDNTLLYASSDDEGNGAGALFIQAGSKTKGIPDGAPVI